MKWNKYRAGQIGVWALYFVCLTGLVLVGVAVVAYLG